MRYGKFIGISTLLAFILVILSCLVWLFKVNETEVTVNGEETSAVYDYALEELDKIALNKSILFLSENKIREELEKNPYLEVKSVKKTLPNKISVLVEKRSERFAFSSGGKYYYADDNFVYLKSEETLIEDSVILIEVTGKDFDFDGSTLGKPFKFSSDDILGCASNITEKIPDKFNLISEIKVDGVKNRLQFKTVTGVTLAFWFNSPDLSATAEEKRAVGKAICEKTGEVLDYYDSLGEAEKSKGFVICYMGVSHEIKTEYKETE